ncbi:MAG: serine protease [Actinomycetota bacterium]
MSATTRNDATPDEQDDAEDRSGSTYRRKGDPEGPVRIRGEAAKPSGKTAKPSGTTSKTAKPSVDRRRKPADDGAATTDGMRRIDGRASGRGSTGRRAPSAGKADRIGGVAPWVPPKGRLGRRLRAREWSRRGFVPLSPGRQKLRHRILPRTVIGIAFMLMATGIGAAFSGAAFYAYYDNRLAENERTVARFVEGFDQQFTDAAGSLDEMRVEAVSTIRGELEPLGDYVADAGGVVGLPVTAGPSVWLVETRDEDGRVVTGSAFAVVGHRGGTALITSYDVIRAATVAPGPAVELLKGDQRITAEVWSWDAPNDLALLVVDAEIPTLDLAGDQAQVGAIGQRVFALSGFGGQGASAAPGVLIDQSSVGLQHTAPVGTLYTGGPLLDGDGRVLGMASAGYSPLGVDPGVVPQAPDVAAICAELLRCAEVDETVTAEVEG